jgi:hypothetical protein
MVAAAVLVGHSNAVAVCELKSACVNRQQAPKEEKEQDED